MLFLSAGHQSRQRDKESIVLLAGQLKKIIYHIFKKYPGPWHLTINNTKEPKKITDIRVYNSRRSFKRVI